jgi:hypothetical protein
MKFTTRFAALAVLAAMALAVPAAADIGPKPTSSGRTPGPSGADVSGIGVRMEAEEVSLLLRRDGPDREKLDVSAVFKMRNDGDSETFETGFPVGAYKNMDAFSIEIDGKRVDFDIVDRAAASPEGKEAPPGGRDQHPDWWYVWSGTYPARTVSTHVVKYTVDLRRGGVAKRNGAAGYVLHTGAGWKGTIGRAVVTLRTGEGLTLDHLERYAPKKLGTRHADRIEWTWTDLEPTKDDDLLVLYFDKPLTEQIAAVREGAKTSWSERTRLARYLGEATERQFRAKLTDAELDEYLDALAAIVAERKTDGDRVILPAGTESDRRGYAGDPNGLFQWMNAAADAVEEYPGSSKAREILRVYIELCAAFLGGKLYAGDAPCAYPWHGPVDTPEARAKRDASVAKRRGECEAWFERAQQVAGLVRGPKGQR